MTNLFDVQASGIVHKPEPNKRRRRGNSIEHRSIECKKNKKNKYQLSKMKYILPPLSCTVHRPHRNWVLIFSHEIGHSTDRLTVPFDQIMILHFANASCFEIKQCKNRRKCWKHKRLSGCHGWTRLIGSTVCVCQELSRSPFIKSQPAPKARASATD
jgi:hypothetical protein